MALVMNTQKSINTRKHKKYARCKLPHDLGRTMMV